MPVDRTALSATTVDDWASRTVYLENLPTFSSVPTPPADIRKWLGELLNTTVQTVRLPPLFSGKDAANGKQQRTAGEPLYDDASLDKDERARRRTFRIPDGGGPFKGFAFAVLGDNAAAERARADWAWDREPTTVPAADEASGDEADEAPVDAPQELSLVEQSQRRGLRIMPMCADSLPCSLTPQHRVEQQARALPVLPAIARNAAGLAQSRSRFGSASQSLVAA